MHLYLGPENTPNHHRQPPLIKKVEKATKALSESPTPAPTNSIE
ncbi:hypothetical protein [Rubritalea tangerina]